MQQSEILAWIATVILASENQCLQEKARGQTADITASYEQNALWVLAIAAELRQHQEMATVDYQTRDH